MGAAPAELSSRLQWSAHRYCLHCYLQQSSTARQHPHALRQQTCRLSMDHVRVANVCCWLMSPGLLLGRQVCFFASIEGSDQLG